MKEEIKIVPGYDDYQKQTTAIKKYPKEDDIRSFQYLMFKLFEETGEVAKEVRKAFDEGKTIEKKKLELELGDCFWVISSLAEQAGIPLSEVVSSNLKKLKKRNLL